MPAVEHLPWIVVYGRWVWLGALLLAVAGAVLLARWRSRRRARREARACQERMREHAVRLDAAKVGERVVVEGRLESEGECARLRDGQPCAVTTVAEEPSTMARGQVSRRAERLALVVGDQRVPLVGAATVRVGSDEAWLRIGLGRAGRALRQRAAAWPPDDLLAYLQPRSEPAVLRSLSAGDPVYVEGQLQVAASDAGGGYRDSAAGFRLDGPLVLACAEAPRVSGPAPRRYGVAAVVGALAWLAVFGAGGALAVDQAEPGVLQRAAVEPAEIDRQMPLAIAAAATPFHRDEALALLGGAYEYSGVPSREWIERVVALFDIRDRCESAVLFLADHGQLEQAAERGRRCPEPRVVAVAGHALIGLGDFAAASELLLDAGAMTDIERRGAVRAHLLAGRIEHAAAALRSDLGAYQHEGSRAAAACLVEALDARSGDAAATARLRAAIDSDPRCRLLLADLLPAGERAAVLEPALASGSRTAIAAHMLAAEAALATGELELVPVLDPMRLQGWVRFEPISFEVVGHPGLERPLLRALAGAGEPLPPALRQLRAALLLQEAKRGLATGDPAAADQLERAIAELEELGVEDAVVAARVLQGYRRVLAGDRRGARKAVAGLSLRYGPQELLNLIEELETGLPSPRDEYLLRDLPQDVLAAATAGDGEPLAAWMHGTVYRQAVATAVYLAPQIERGGEAILDYLAHARRFNYLGMPFEERLAFVARRRLIAAALAAEEAAAAQAQIARRALEALSRRDTAVPLLVFESL